MNTGILNKSTGDFLSANEFNQLNDSINSKIDGGYSLSQLRLLSETDLTKTKTFYCNEVGKEGFWKYDSTDIISVDNTGTTIVTIGGKRLKRVINDYNVNIRWFGATGSDNYSNNDDLFFNNALIFCDANKYTLNLGFGYYWLNNTYTLTSNTKIIGEHNEKTFIYYKGNSILFQTNIDDGNGENAQLNNGSQDCFFSNITFRAIGSNQVSLTTLNMKPYGTVDGYYVPSTKCIVDRRGGGVVLNNIRFKNFEKGYYGYYADFNKFDNVQFDFCVNGLYLNCNSDQALLTRLKFFACINAIDITGSNSITFDSIQIITCGNDTTPPVRLNSSTANFGAVLNNITFRNVWVEQNGDTITPTNNLRIDSIFDVKSYSTIENINIFDIKLVLPDGIGSTGNTDDRRVNYLISCFGNIKKINIFDIVGINALQIGYLKVLSGSPIVEINTLNYFNNSNKKIISNFGFDNPQYVIKQQISYNGYQQQFTQGENGIFRTISNNTDTNWKKIAVMSIPNENTYTGCIFKINIIDVFSNYRVYQMSKEYQYICSVTRSLGVSNDNNIAVIYGDPTGGYIRILKIQNGSVGNSAIFEIQFKGKTAYNSTRITLEVVSNSNCNIDFYENLPSGSTSYLTEYTANTDPITKKGVVNLVGGVANITVFGLTNNNNVIVSLKTINGTMSTTYQGYCSTNTITINGLNSSGVINTSDNSTITYQIIN
jgi:hypothetical protein